MRNIHFLWSGFLCFTLVSCVSLKPESFRSFETSVGLAQKGLETEMARDVAWTREADVDSLAETKEAPLSDYMLKEVEGYDWKMAGTSPHWETRLTLRALEEMNAAFKEYATLLAQVAEGHFKEPQDHDALAATMNKSLREAQATIVQTKGSSPLIPAGAAAFSVENILYCKRFGRAKALRSAVQKNQPWVESYTVQCLALLDRIRADLKAAYANRMEALHNRWDDKRTPGRNTLARSIFNLNAQYADAMESLKTLFNFYNNLPMAHHELAEGLTVHAKSPKALSTLAAFADQVARRTRALEKSR